MSIQCLYQEFIVTFVARDLYKYLLILYGTLYSVLAVTRRNYILCTNILKRHLWQPTPMIKVLVNLVSAHHSANLSSCASKNINCSKMNKNSCWYFYEKRLYYTSNISVECKTGNILQPYNNVMYRSTVRPFITNFAATALSETDTGNGIQAKRG